ncbi:MAG: hypothetical protein AB7O38_21395 [Pirellulaceae bacterium]
MTDSPLVTLGPDAVDLLLKLLEQPEPVLSGAMAADYYPAQSAALKTLDLLLDDGYDAVAVPEFDHDDQPLSLDWDADQNSYCYRGQDGRPHFVSGERLRRYRLDIVTAISRMTATIRQPHRRPADPLADDMIWDAGMFALPGRSAGMSVWFARRLSDPQVWSHLRRLNRIRPPSGVRVVLTSTRIEQIVEETRLPRLLSLSDLLASSGDIAIGPTLLVASLDALPPARHDGLPEISADGRVVRFRGVTYEFPKGEQQRRILRHLYERALDGELWVSTADIVAELDLTPRIRMRDIFKGHNALGHLICERKGRCGFCWGDDA